MNQRDQTPEDVDVFLRDYFHRETPRPWPALKASVATTRAHSWSLGRSRFVLAASVALLLGGTFYLSGKFRNQPATPTGTLEATRHTVGSERETGGAGRSQNQRGRVLEKAK